MISHENTFLSNFVSFLTIVLFLHQQFQNQLFFSHFFQYFCNVLFLDFILYLISSFIHGGSLSSNLMTLVLTKFYIHLKNLHWKTIYSNQSGLKPFGLSLHWNFCNPKQAFGKAGGYIICRFILIFWEKLALWFDI